MVYMYHSFLVHSSADCRLGCFHVLAMINSAAMNIGVHVSLSDLVSSVCMPRSGIAGSYGSMQNRKRDTDVQNRHLDSVGEGEGGMFRGTSIETCILSMVKQITSQGGKHKTSARGWCPGLTQRDRVVREVGGGLGWGIHVNPWLIHVNV